MTEADRTRRPLLASHVRRSPYFARTEAAGAVAYIPYNHMYMPMAYGRPPVEDYRALVDRVTLWDVGAERQTELRGPRALEFADYLCTRDLSELQVDQCRYSLVCDPEGRIMCDPVVLRVAKDVVWLSHGDVDLTLWARGIAMTGWTGVNVLEPEVSPLQVQGPRSLEVMQVLTTADLTDLEFYHCLTTQVAGVDAVVSRTGWSGGLGFEIYPFSDERALKVWDAVMEAGKPHGILITGPNISRAVERGITDTSYYANSGMNPFESGQARLVDLHARPFVGQESLLAISRQGAVRKTVGLVASGELPFLEEYWTVRRNSNEVGEVRWATWSFGLDRPIAIALVTNEVEIGQSLTIRHAGGDVSADVVSIPFV